MSRLSHHHRSRAAILTAALFALLLLVPVAARADDRSFATVAIEQAGKLARYETATNRALVRTDEKGHSAIPAARRAVRATRTQIDRALVPIRAEQTSTPDGADVKRKLIDLLRREKQGYKTVDRALAAFLRDDVSTGNALQRRAKEALAKVRREAQKLAPALAKLRA